MFSVGKIVLHAGFAGLPVSVKYWEYAGAEKNNPSASGAIASRIKRVLFDGSRARDAGDKSFNSRRPVLGVP